MKIKLLEIEFGSKDLESSNNFYQRIFDSKPAIDQSNLKVFNLKANQIDFNISKHFNSAEICTTFLTDNLEEMMANLRQTKIEFNGPTPSHLGMISIDFRDPDGHLLKVNQATSESPDWLKFAELETEN